jgi:ABC-2 type transport system ATP-binding protein
LSKRFDTKSVLKDINFTFESGKIYGLLGRNGAGKTTLFNCLNSDLRTDGGEFYLRESGARRDIRPEDIGYVLSTPEVPEFLTAREFLRFFLDINERDGVLPRSADSYFDEVSINPEDRDRLLKDFSQGMKNKMQMLANIIAEPLVTLLDEPLTSLDVVVAEEMKDLLRTLKPGRVTILSTHILDLAVDLCDEIVLLSGGRLESIPHADLSDDGFKERIIATLRSENTQQSPDTQRSQA